MSITRVLSVIAFGCDQRDGGEKTNTVAASKEKFKFGGHQKNLKIRMRKYMTRTTGFILEEFQVHYELLKWKSIR